MIEKLKSLKNHQGFMKYFKNTSWLFTVISTLGLNGIVVRELGKGTIVTYDNEYKRQHKNRTDSPFIDGK